MLTFNLIFSLNIRRTDKIVKENKVLLTLVVLTK